MHPPGWEADISRLHPTRSVLLAILKAPTTPSFLQTLGPGLLATLLPKSCHHPGGLQLLWEPCIQRLGLLSSKPHISGASAATPAQPPIAMQSLNLRHSPWSLHLQNLSHSALVRAASQHVPALSSYLFFSFAVITLG